MPEPQERIIVRTDTCERWVLLGDITNSTKVLRTISRPREDQPQIHLRLMARYNATLESIWIKIQRGIDTYHLHHAFLAGVLGDGFIVLGAEGRGMHTLPQEIAGLLEYAGYIKEFADDQLRILVESLEEDARSQEIGDLNLREIVGAGNNPPLLMRIMVGYGNIFITAPLSEQPREYEPLRFTGDVVNFCSKMMNRTYETHGVGNESDVIFITNLHVWQNWMTNALNNNLMDVPVSLGDTLLDTMYSESERRVYRLFTNEISDIANRIINNAGD